MDWRHLPHVGHMLHQVREGEKHADLTGDTKEGKLAAVGYIVIGFFLTPMLIGIPIMGYGLYKLTK